MKKRFIAVVLSCVLAVGLTACSDDWDEEYDEYEDYEEGEDEAYGEGSGEFTVSERAMGMTVDGETGVLTVERPEVTGKGIAGEEGVWTIFVYLCGTDLETGSGAGTDDMIEMMYGYASDEVRFVVQTGGTEEWMNEQVDGSCLQRYLVQYEDAQLVDEQPLEGMGEADTLSSFLTWGMDNYASEHMGLVFWNHGGGSIAGVCFDETDDFDSLSLTELDEALYSSLQYSGRKFDFIGFDACLMGTVETAHVMANYADYMYASEEMEPGSGWDYTSIADFLAENPEADAKALGEVVCDSFYEACLMIDDADIATMSVIDLSKVDDLLIAFNNFAKGMYESGQDAEMLASMVRSIGSTDNFGGNNKTEGYTNMVDLGGILSACEEYADGADAAKQALDEAVVYSVSGSDHEGAGGLSIYYPLSVQGSEELSVFSNICVSPYYLSFVDRQNQTGATSADNADYDDEQWFDDSGEWEYGSSEDDEYWEYLDDYEQTGESPYITFEVEPFLDEEGSFWFQLDEDGYYNTAAVGALVYALTPDETEVIEYGETVDVDADWDYGIFADYFDGYWVSLPDGQNLATYIVEETEDYVVYTSPVLINDEELNLRLRQDYSDGSITIEGAWEGISESGAAGRDIIKLEEGDEIVPMYYAYGLEDDEESVYIGEPYVMTSDPELYYDIMDVGDYFYSFYIDDIYGDYYLTDYVMFYVDENGDVSFYEE